MSALSNPLPSTRPPKPKYKINYKQNTIKPQQPRPSKQQELQHFEKYLEEVDYDYQHINSTKEQRDQREDNYQQYSNALPKLNDVSVREAILRQKNQQTPYSSNLPRQLVNQGSGPAAQSGGNGSLLLPGLALPPVHQSPAIPRTSKLDIFAQPQNHEATRNNQKAFVRSNINADGLHSNYSYGGSTPTNIYQQPPIRQMPSRQYQNSPQRLYQKMEQNYQVKMAQKEQQQKNMNLMKKMQIQKQRPQRIVDIDYQRRPPPKSQLDGYLERQYGLQDIQVVDSKKKYRQSRPEDQYEFNNHYQSNVLTRSESSSSVKNVLDKVKQEYNYNRNIHKIQRDKAQKKIVRMRQYGRVVQEIHQTTNDYDTKLKILEAKRNNIISQAAYQPSSYNQVNAYGDRSRERIAQSVNQEYYVQGGGRKNGFNSNDPTLGITFSSPNLERGFLENNTEYQQAYNRIKAQFRNESKSQHKGDLPYIFQKQNQSQLLNKLEQQNPSAYRETFNQFEGGGAQQQDEVDFMKQSRQVQFHSPQINVLDPDEIPVQSIYQKQMTFSAKPVKSKIANFDETPVGPKKKVSKKQKQKAPISEDDEEENEENPEESDQQEKQQEESEEQEDEAEDANPKKKKKMQELDNEVTEVNQRHIPNIGEEYIGASYNDMIEAIAAKNARSQVSEAAEMKHKLNVF